MKFWLLLLVWPVFAWAVPQLELNIQLDPASRHFAASGVLRDVRDLSGFHLSRDFEVTELKANGVSIPPRRRLASADFFSLPSGTRRVELRYRAKLAPTLSLDHRQVLRQRAATASPEGSFLPASSGWYPRAAEFFHYRLTLELPAGQKGLVAGNLKSEQQTADGYRAEFDFPHPADGIDLMAGPYVVREQPLTLPAGRRIVVRTWFHPELTELAAAYLDDSARYLMRYSRLIGDYPFEIFSVVSSPTPTGFGMPSLTYLGREVIKLPFIRATSLGHEVLHNWWGNGVYPDWDSGNWSEGLTTFLADYAYKEEEGETAAREMRIGWLRDYAAVPPGADMALKDFTSRHHGIASVIGYNKAAMVFLMLRDRIGQEAFERGLQLLWAQKRFQVASWSDLEVAFSAASGRSQATFFRQWVNQASAPTFSADEIARDSDYRLWRRIDPAQLPPILREVFIAPKVRLIVADTDAEVRQAANALAARVLDAKDMSGGNARLIIGRDTTIERWLADNALPPPPAALRGKGSARVWAGRDGSGKPYVVVSGRDAAALAALQRGLPHYGKQGWLVFEGGRASEKGLELPGSLTAPGGRPSH
ncbi:MAG: M1 family aminopeptidase [Rhodocyclaceae bacterium]|nr:M1 family aminopeptidase [Rhodocyclaceae bacterium]MDZ4216131.1 M1 family aminopeptidase [Rhodocyclaceae bacterium]